MTLAKTMNHHLHWEEREVQSMHHLSTYANVSGDPSFSLSEITMVNTVH